MVSDTMSQILLGYGKILLCVIIVGRFQEFVVCELDGVSGGTRGDLIFIATPICIFVQAAKGTNPREK